MSFQDVVNIPENEGKENIPICEEDKKMSFQD